MKNVPNTTVKTGLISDRFWKLLFFIFFASVRKANVRYKHYHFLHYAKFYPERKNEQTVCTSFMWEPELVNSGYRDQSLIAIFC